MPTNEQLTEFKMNLADIVISVVSADPKVKFNIDSARAHFSTDADPDIMLCLHSQDELLLPKPEESVFHSGGLWSLAMRNGKYLLCGMPGIDEPANRVAVISKDLRYGDIYVNKSVLRDNSYEYPLHYPLDEILMINILADSGGMLVHSCGIKYKDKGAIFVGQSGAGKSTISGLWAKDKDAVILSDDRIIIRRIKDKFRIFGTPWHGDVDICSSESSDINRIFFLKHAKENTLTKISPMDAASRLVVRSFLPLWDKERMNRVLKFVSELLCEVPCFELGFLPDKSALEFLEDKI